MQMKCETMSKIPVAVSIEKITDNLAGARLTRVTMSTDQDTSRRHAPGPAGLGNPFWRTGSFSQWEGRPSEGFGQRRPLYYMLCSGCYGLYPGPLATGCPRALTCCSSLGNCPWPYKPPCPAPCPTPCPSPPCKALVNVCGRMGDTTKGQLLALRWGDSVVPFTLQGSRWGQAEAQSRQDLTLPCLSLICTHPFS